MAKTQTQGGAVVGGAVVAAIEAAEAQKPTGLALLREPFPAHQISKLPKPLKKREEMEKLPKAKCAECGGYHQTSSIIHLDYVGHAALTDRLLDADPMWNWEPVADPIAKGLPVAPGGMWITLTVCGVSRYGFGSADGKSGGDAIKELIGDALRNAAMRFGAALDLWHKGELHKEEDAEDAEPEGYAEWLLDFEATADNGLLALQAAWKAAPEPFRKFLPAEKREALKAKARAVAA